MTEPAENDTAHLQNIVREINEDWRARRYDRIGTRIADDAIIAPPGFDGRIRGRDAYVQSYRDYDQAATTLKFVAGEPQIDVVGDVAVAVTPFEVIYRIESRRHHETGHDILVFSRIGGQWQIVWRTMQVNALEE